jgi:hypothetical protein
MGFLRSKKSFALEIATKPLVMASEISGLEPLCGFIKQENRVVPVRFALAKKRCKQPEFIERTPPELIPRVKLEANPPIAVVQTKSPTKKPVAAVQVSLPLSPATDLEAKEVYVWDESKGID